MTGGKVTSGATIVPPTDVCGAFALTGQGVLGPLLLIDLGPVDDAVGLFTSGREAGKKGVATISQSPGGKVLWLLVPSEGLIWTVLGSHCCRTCSFGLCGISCSPKVLSSLCVWIALLLSSSRLSSLQCLHRSESWRGGSSSN